MFLVQRVILIQMVVFSVSQTAFADLSEVGTNSGTYQGHTSQFADGVTAVSYTHLTLPTNREV